MSRAPITDRLGGIRPVLEEPVEAREEFARDDRHVQVEVRARELVGADLLPKLHRETVERFLGDIVYGAARLDRAIEQRRRALQVNARGVDS